MTVIGLISMLVQVWLLYMDRGLVKHLHNAVAHLVSYICRQWSEMSKMTFIKKINLKCITLV